MCISTLSCETREPTSFDHANALITTSEDEEEEEASSLKQRPQQEIKRTTVSNDHQHAATSPPALRRRCRRRRSGNSGGGRKPAKHPHIVVQHDYHDHAQDPAPCASSAGGTEPTVGLLPCGSGSATVVEDFAASSCSSTTVIRGGVATPFPLKLYSMLELVERDGNSQIVSWQPHGRCFVVHEPAAFKLLLPRYFKLNKIASFQRQLNLYGFVRLTKGNDKGGYYNELFLRGKPWLVRRIQRVKVKGTGVRARSNPAQEPDFWRMTWMQQGSNNGGTTHAAAATTATITTTAAEQRENDKNVMMTATPTTRIVTRSSSVVSDGESNSPTEHHKQSNQDKDVEPREEDEEEEEELPSVVRVARQDMELDDHHHEHQGPTGGGSSTLMVPSPGSEEDNGNDDDTSDIVLTGWGKPFHYLEHFPAVAIAAAEEQPKPVVLRPLPAPSMLVKMEPAAAIVKPPSAISSSSSSSSSSSAAVAEPATSTTAAPDLLTSSSSMMVVEGTTSTASDLLTGSTSAPPETTTSMPGTILLPDKDADLLEQMDFDGLVRDLLDGGDSEFARLLQRAVEQEGE